MICKPPMQTKSDPALTPRCLQAGADTNNDGCIDLDEFQHMIESPQVRRVLREADVDATTLINFADVLFEAQFGKCFYNLNSYEFTYSEIIELPFYLIISESGAFSCVQTWRCATCATLCHATLPHSGGGRRTSHQDTLLGIHVKNAQAAGKQHSDSEGPRGLAQMDA